MCLPGGNDLNEGGFKFFRPVQARSIDLPLTGPQMNSLSAVCLIPVFFSPISHLPPLKSKRLASSFLAWLTAFSISIVLTCETMSNEGMGKA
jgi:hypothetical protein